MKKMNSVMTAKAVNRFIVIETADQKIIRVQKKNLIKKKRDMNLRMRAIIMTISRNKNNVRTKTNSVFSTNMIHIMNKKV